ncbi:hypothetical protein NE235_02500 [Actinoallomurus spadix]|uniref:hypothetical protein n=1 Tax=Actinoallomurus spadix TaxID=79912 RepID=UPI002093C048|nr:hypothetical protein [Actinoallomurus spadix]MCO5984972.1 hypothetical protein [Actinoallomurus spadix]
MTRTVREEPSLLRRLPASGILVLLASSALSPVLEAGLSGASVTEAIASVAGNVGSGYLTNLITNVAARVRGGGSSDIGEAKRLLTDELQAALDKGDARANELNDSLISLIREIGGLEAATDDLRVHLLACFEELHAQIRERDAERQQQDRRRDAAQRHHDRQVQKQLQEILELLRFLMRDAGDPASPPTHPVFTPVVVPSAAGTSTRAGTAWEGGIEHTVGDRVYLLRDVLLDERPHQDGAVFRQAQALRTIPHGGPDRYVWLRQVRANPDLPEGRRALRALDRERRLLSRLREPRLSQYVADGHTATIAVVWPVSRRNGTAKPLSPSDPPGLFSLLGGLAGLCDTLAGLHALGATHRLVTPDRIVVHDDGRLSFLDLGLAGHDPVAGESTSDYLAPEQRRRGSARPGPYTDVYQLAALAYHLVTGHPPHPRTPLPVGGQAPGLPAPAGAAIDAALSAGPDARPTAPSLGAALRAARDQL